MPVIEKQLGKLTILKPSYLNLKVAQTVEVEITAPHMDNSGLLSIPAKTPDSKGDMQEGNFPLNTTNLRILTPELGDNSDSWVGAKFKALVIPSSKPSGGGTVTGWAVIEGSIKKPPKA